VALRALFAKVALAKIGKPRRLVMVPLDSAAVIKTVKRRKNKHRNFTSLRYKSGYVTIIFN
jgi:hypothetical protein